MTNHDQGRARWIDAAKGLGIALIVFGHIFSTVTPPRVYEYIYAFHVPLFFFLSGVTLRPGSDTLNAVVGKKVRTLLVPYLWYSLLGYGFYLAGYLFAQQRGMHIAQFDHGLWAPLAGIFYGTIGEGRLINGPLWFIAALFCTYLLGYLINTHIRAVAAQWMAVAALASIGFGLAGNVALPFSGVPALIALLFFQAGYRMPVEAWWQASSKGSRWAWMVGLLLVFAVAPMNGFIQFGEGLIGNPLAFLLFAFSGLMATVLLLRLFDEHTRWLAWLGRYSLSIMLIHMLIIKAVKVLLAMSLQVRLDAIENSAGLGLLVLMATIALLVPAVWLMERYLPLTLGKPSQRSQVSAARA